MSTPKITGFRGSTPFTWLKILDTADDEAFDLGVVVPGNTKANYEGYWFNLGPAQLHDPQMSLVSHPTLDLGANADTIDVMKLAASATDALGFATPAKAGNTSGWSVPMTDPFMPWSQRFQCGIIWEPGALATPGIIRKAIQWDGGYFPDTWDYMWAPLANQAMPWATQYDYPFSVHEGPGSHHEKIEVESLALTGYRLNLWVPITTGDYIYYRHTTGSPWTTNVDNSTGYLIKTRCRWYGSGEGYPFGFDVKDGSYSFRVRWQRDGSTYRICCFADEGFASYQEAVINAVYRDILIEVQGTTFKLYVDGSLSIAATLDTATTDKILEWGGITKRPSGTHWGTWYAEYLKYYCGGITEPLY